LLTGKSNLVEGARRVLELGPKFVVIKKGEHGAIYCDRETLFALPGYPLERVVDPTGAGDTFAGAMMGYLATTKQTSREAIKRSLVYGTLMASFCVEDFSLQRLQQINLADVDARLGQFRTMLAV
jgi:sugar/nucleoside kinase (ribokinase family)